MIKEYLEKSIALGILAASILAINPIGASAEWKRNSSGWWYSEGNSYVRNGWKQIDSKWYYFNFEGYIIQNAWMYEGYYLNSSGEWTGTSKYRRNDILKNGVAHCASGKMCYEAGDQSNLRVINNEPCIYTWDKDDVAKYIGMNTLNLYDIRGNNVDKVVL